MAFGLALGGAVVVALPVSEARAEKADPGTAALEARVRQLETRMAKVEARMAEHEKPQAGHAAHGGQTGMPGNAPDQPMGQMPQQHTMPPQADPQQGMPMGGGTGGGMTDM
ncbi:MAG: hypothetical protein K2P78_04650 [Gemmataceae bacterium]|nr:hypothetical protein [Gemmataceae bacterium]